MLANQMLSELFGFAKSMQNLFRPMLLILILLIIAAPKDSTKLFLQNYVKAIFCYLLMSMGVVLMSFGAVPATMAVMTGVTLTPEEYLGLMLVFATGGILYLWMDQQVRTMPDAPKKIPSVLFHYSFKLIGHLSILFAAIAVSIAVAFQTTSVEGWWSVPVITLLFGSVLCWATASEPYRLNWLMKALDNKLEESAKPRTPAKRKTRTKKK